MGAQYFATTASRHRSASGPRREIFFNLMVTTGRLRPKAGIGKNVRKDSMLEFTGLRGFGAGALRSVGRHRFHAQPPTFGQLARACAAQVLDSRNIAFEMRPEP